MIVGTARFIDGTSSTSIFVFSYPYVLVTGAKKEYYELTYTMYYEGGNDMAMKQLEAFFTNLELTGTSPF